MPTMNSSDFGENPPKNADEIIQHINNLILYHEEYVFWSADPINTEQWGADLIKRCLSGDRNGDLSKVPNPIY